MRTNVSIRVQILKLSVLVPFTGELERVFLRKRSHGQGPRTNTHGLFNPDRTLLQRGHGFLSTWRKHKYLSCNKIICEEVQAYNTWVSLMNWRSSQLFPTSEADHWLPNSAGRGSDDNFPDTLAYQRPSQDFVGWDPFGREDNVHAADGEAHEVLVAPTQPLPANRHFRTRVPLFRGNSCHQRTPAPFRRARHLNLSLLGQRLKNFNELGTISSCTTKINFVSPYSVP